MNQVINHSHSSEFRIPNSEFQKVSAILLAAGLSRRMKKDKLLLLYSGKSLLQHAIDLLANLPVSERILVTTSEKLGYIGAPSEIKIVLNENPDVGQSESVKLGVRAAASDIYLFITADQPKLTTNDVAPLIAAAIKNKDKIIYPIINETPTTPTLFPAHFRDELLALTGDTGGRAIRDKYHESSIAVEVENPDNFTDIDDIEDYMKLATSVYCHPERSEGS